MCRGLEGRRPLSKFVQLDSTSPTTFSCLELTYFSRFPSPPPLPLPQYPEFYSFPPFFTIQPVLTTREKQMGLWRELILSYHTQQKIKVMRVHDCPLWKNADIGRELSPDDIQQVMEDFVKHGNGEWDDPQSNTRCRILWRKPEQLATDIYQFAKSIQKVMDDCLLLAY